METRINTCPTCKKEVRSHAHFLQCNFCLRKVHRNCTLFTKEEFNAFHAEYRSWSCRTCNSFLFPFNHMDENDEFELALYELQLNKPVRDDQRSRNAVFDPFILDSDEHDIPLSNIDPDALFFNEQAFSLRISSNYHSEMSFNKLIANHDSMKNGLSMIHLNIKSLPGKLTDFMSFMENLDISFSCIAVTETWLSPDNADCYNIPGYNHVFLTRSDRQRGGVSLFIREDIEYTELNHMATYESYVECIFVQIVINTKKYIVSVVYHPPNTSMKDFTCSLSEKLESLKQFSSNVYLLGDYNVDLLKTDSHKDSADFLDMLFSHGFIPLINRPTRITEQTATIIDNIYTNNLNVNDQNLQGILSPNVSDHEAVFHLIDLKLNKKSSDMTHLIRRMNDKSYALYINRISQFDWERVKQYTTCQSAFTFFSTSLKRIFDECFPVVKVKQTYRNRMPWLSEGLKQSIKFKNKLYRIQVKHPTSFNKTYYKQYRNKLHYLINLEEKKYYQNLILENRSNMRETWKIIKRVINRNKTSRHVQKFKFNDQIVSDKGEIATHFNNFFANIGPNLASNIPGPIPDFRKYMPEVNPYTIFLSPVTDVEIKKIVQSFKKGAPGWDEITADSVQCVLDYIGDALCYICNLSLNDGVFPNELKLTRIVPIYKANDPMLFTNYRPISLLSIFSKLLETVMYKRLTKFIDKYKLLYKLQFGFREQHSTYMPLILLMDKVTEALDNGNFVIGIFLDFRKAFDTVDHDILLDKLYRYGIRGIAHSWFKSYLNNRQQFVKFDDTVSGLQTIKCGIPQGSILGPLLFLLYINDLATVSNIFMSFLFADDTNLFLTGNDLSAMGHIINTELIKIKDWLKANKLSLNIDKINFILFKPRHRHVTDIKIYMDGSEIHRVTEAKFLGVIIDEKLNWSNHIAYIQRKISKSIGIIIKTRKLFNSETLISLYNSLVYPYLSYCVHVWGEAYDVHKYALVVQQKKIVRIISGVPPRTHTKPLFSKLKILTLDGIYRYMLALFMYKYVNDMIPPLFDMFIVNADIHHYNTRNHTLLHVPLCTTKRSQQTVRYTGVKLWNLLATSIDVNCKIGTFKKHLKEFIITSS